MLAPANNTAEKIAATVANRLVGILCVNIVQFLFVRFDVPLLPVIIDLNIPKI